MFQAEIYKERRKRLQEKLDSGLILLMGNGESPINYTDNTYRFRQDSHFLYFFGIGRPGLAATIDLDEQRTTLFGDELTMDHIVWMGPQPTIAEQAAQVGVAETAPFAELEQRLSAAIKAKRTIHFLPPYRGENKIQLSQWLKIPIAELSGKASESLIRAVISLASIKGPEEVAEMEKAVNISREMHLAAMRAARPGILEARLAGIVEGIALGMDSQLAYPAILTINGQTLHNHSHSNILQSGQLVLGDFGAEAPGSHYAGDITRAFPVDKQFTGRQKDIYNIVLKAEEEAIKALKPGLPYRDVHLMAAGIIVDGLKSLGLMEGDTEEAVNQGAHALFFPHGLGHMIGLDVHDMEGLGEDWVGYGEGVERSSQFGLKSLRLGRPLKAGFVLTVEPGIYFIPELIGQWKEEGKFASFIKYDKLDDYLQFGGIRIEDNILITEKGYRILGAPIPKTVEDVEAVRKEA